MVGRSFAAAALLVAGGATAAAQPPRTDAPYTLARTLVTEAVAPDGQTYRLFVAWPDGAPPPGGWPALFVLDGADTFAVTVETARRLARAGARNGIDEGVIVGIDSGTLARRVLDYTPAVPGYRIPAGLPAHGLAVGGGERFLATIGGTIMPRVAARWRIDPRRQTLAGHSFGGVLALHAACGGAPAPAFSAYAAISPSVWYGHGLLVRDAAAGRCGPARLLIAAGDREGQGGTAATATAGALAADLGRTGATTRFLPLAGQGHGTTMLAATGEIVALAFGRAEAR